MIREALVGVALVGGGGYYVASNYQGADLVRTVNATPHDSWRSFDMMLNQDYAGSGITPANASLSWPSVKSVDGREIDYIVRKDGKQAIHINLKFEPVGDGHQTRMTLNADLAAELMPNGFVKQAAFKSMLGKVMDEIIPQIENGKGVRAAEAMAEMRRKMVADPRFAESRLRAEEWEHKRAQAAASAPMVNPDTMKLNPRGMDVTPEADRY
jgi:hypothetical protein